MHLTEIGVIFLLESFSRAGHTGGGEEGGGGGGGEGWGGVGRVGGAMPLLYRTLPENCFCRVIKNLEHIKSV